MHSKMGVYKITSDGTQLKLKAGKAYDLGGGEEKTFYIYKYKCVFRKKKKNQAASTNKKSNNNQVGALIGQQKPKLNIYINQRSRQFEDDIEEEGSQNKQKANLNVSMNNNNNQYSKSDFYIANSPSDSLNNFMSYNKNFKKRQTRNSQNLVIDSSKSSIQQYNIFKDNQQKQQSKSDIQDLEYEFQPKINNSTGKKKGLLQRNSSRDFSMQDEEEDAHGTNKKQNNEESQMDLEKLEELFCKKKLSQSQYSQKKAQLLKGGVDDFDIDSQIKQKNSSSNKQSDDKQKTTLKKLAKATESMILKSQNQKQKLKKKQTPQDTQIDDQFSLYDDSDLEKEEQKVQIKDKQAKTQISTNNKSVELEKKIQMQKKQEKSKIEDGVIDKLIQKYSTEKDNLIKDNKTINQQMETEVNLNKSQLKKQSLIKKKKEMDQEKEEPKKLNLQKEEKKVVNKKKEKKLQLQTEIELSEQINEPNQHQVKEKGKKSQIKNVDGSVKLSKKQQKKVDKTKQIVEKEENIIQQYVEQEKPAQQRQTRNNNQLKENLQKEPKDLQIQIKSEKKEAQQTIKGNKKVNKSKIKSVNKFIRKTGSQREVKALANYFYSVDPNIQQKRNAYKVLFSNCDVDKDTKEALKKMGAQIVVSVEQPFNLLVMGQFKRRVKLLTAINVGAQIVSSDWVYECIIEKKLLDPSYFPLRVDNKIQQKFDFNLQESIKLAKQTEKGIFDDLTIFLPENSKFTNLSRNDVEVLIRTGGGKLLVNKPKDNIDNCIIILQEDDKELIQQYFKEGFPVYSLEFILSGCLQQRLDFDQYILSNNLNRKKNK